MSNGKAHTMIRYASGAAIVDCLDVKLNDEMTIQAWGEELTAAAENCQIAKLIVNFNAVKFMSSSALRVLITLNTKARAQKITLYLCGINANIMDVFKITKLDSLFNIRQTEQEAIKSMK
ncbi:MAG: STAS domain-containing protein [Thermoguttaceae bacterium]|nr:STAS domain-containing protein [Thermoguttaceae bacterium]